MGFTVNVTTPGCATRVLPRAYVIRDGRHLPLSRRLPVGHFAALAEKTPNLPFWNVSNQLSVPGFCTERLNVIAPVRRLIFTWSSLKLLSGASSGASGAVSGDVDGAAPVEPGDEGPGVAPPGAAATAIFCCWVGAGSYSLSPA